MNHNHPTRDIKAPGKCPACDEYWAQDSTQDRIDPDRGFTLISGALHSCNECGAIVAFGRRAPHLAWHARINRLLDQQP